MKLVSVFVLYFYFLAPLGTKAQSTAAMHETWDAVLKKHVDDNGMVDYEGILKEPAFSRYIGMLQKVKGAELYGRNDALAYWINVYNAFTVKLIVDYWPVKSIKDIPQAWENKFIKLPSGTYSLNQIENDIIRPKFQEPRIHFALVCAAVSCPKLHNRAFTDQNLESLLESLTKGFLTNKERTNVSLDKLQISELFNWYVKDFEAAGGVKEFVKKYTGVSSSKGATIEYLPYNWDLNSKKL